MNIGARARGSVSGDVARAPSCTSSRRGLGRTSGRAAAAALAGYLALMNEHRRERVGRRERGPPTDLDAHSLRELASSSSRVYARQKESSGDHARARPACPEREREPRIMRSGDLRARFGRSRGLRGFRVG